VFTDSRAGSVSCPVTSPGTGSARYNPRLLGGGSVVPYIGSWTGEANCPTQVVRRPDNGIGYLDETILDRDQSGVLWTRIASRVGVGSPLFKSLHPVRQRRAMSRLLCQVCAQPADHTERGTLWLAPGDEVGGRPGWPGEMTTIHPPLCVACARISVRMCPALRQGATAVRAHSRVRGVNGVVFAPAGRYPGLSVTDRAEVIPYGDPEVAWVQATLLARSLYDATVIDLDGLAP
jgi:hypothetical protein